MERHFTLDPNEGKALTQIEQARTQALAMVGALSLDMEQARKQLEIATERQRAFIQTAVTARGIETFTDARVLNGSLVVSLPDETPVAPVKANGRVIDVVQEQ